MVDVETPDVELVWTTNWKESATEHTTHQRTTCESAGDPVQPH